MSDFEVTQVGQYDKVVECLTEEIGRLITVIMEKQAEIEAPSVPVGWQLVPVEATPKMQQAGQMNWDHGDKFTSEIWSDMLAAAPTPGDHSG
jgi:hypothetical protein